MISTKPWGYRKKWEEPADKEVEVGKVELDKVEKVELDKVGEVERGNLRKDWKEI